MSATVHAGEKGVDSSFSHPPLQVLLDAGFGFRVGYISVPPASPGKNITVAECVDTITAGIKLNLVFEMSATRATLGAAYGTADGLAAKQEALLRGQPTDVPIIFADDTSTTTANLPKKIAYMFAADAACKPFDIGIYGGVKILAATVGLWKIGWVPTSAWSWSVNLTRLPKETDAAFNARGRAAARQAAIDIGAHVIQGPSFYLGQKWAVDPNEAIADFPAWGLVNDPAPQPSPQEDDMLELRPNAEPRVNAYGGTEAAGEMIFAVGDFKRNISGDERKERFANVPLSPALSNAVLNKIPDATSGGGPTDQPTLDRLAKLETVILQLNDALGRVGQSVGDMQSGLVRAGTPA